MTRRNWKHVQSNSQLHALELRKGHAKKRHNLSVERIAERMKFRKGISHGLH
ncbi:hypothetical protein [Burkholderia glumae]|nr:hypothetical protein [Burkholderia glumae]